VFIQCRRAKRPYLSFPTKAESVPLGRAHISSTADQRYVQCSPRCCDIGTHLPLRWPLNPLSLMLTFVLAIRRSYLMLSLGFKIEQRMQMAPHGRLLY
jgi:hypothetical protein